MFFVLIISATYPVISSLRFIWICDLFLSRQVFECFLKDIVVAYKNGTNQIFVSVDCLDAADRKAFHTAATSRYPSMSAIERAVRNPNFQTAVWKHFGFEEHMKYPVLSDDLLYGTLSNAVHNKVFKQILVSDIVDDDYKRFFAVLGERYGQKVLEYSEMDASTYEDRKERKQASGDGDVDEKEH
jgi:hypothetical protein